MKCKKLFISCILLFGLCCFCHSQETSASFVRVYTTLDKLEAQVKDLNLNLLAQRALSQQLQDSLNQATKDLTASQQDYQQAAAQLEQSQTALTQALAAAETSSKQLLSCERSLKFWRGAAIATTAIAATAILVLILNKEK